MNAVRQQTRRWSERARRAPLIWRLSVAMLMGSAPVGTLACGPAPEGQALETPARVIASGGDARSPDRRNLQPDRSLRGKARSAGQALREARIDRQTRSVAAEVGQELEIQIPGENPPLQGHKIWVGYARSRSRTAQEAVLEVMDTSGHSPRLLLRNRLDLGQDSPRRWRDVNFPVPKGVRRISLRVVSGAASEAPPPVILSQPAVVPQRASAQRPNVVLVSIDTLRADFLNTYGYQEYPTSPHIDRWAGRGVVFEQAIAPTPWTVPSHISIFTGVDPDALGMDRLVHKTPRLPEARSTLAELLHEFGYLTVAFTGGGTVGARNGFGDGFYLYQDGLYDLKLPDLQPTIELAREWLEQSGGQPIFLFLHTFEVHAPYKHDRYASPALSAASRTRARYASSIAHTDRLLGEFLHFLETRGLMDNTLLILTSDHGEGFLDERGLPEHGKSLYDEVLHVPLILSGPGIPPGRRIRQQVPLQDLFATLVDYLDLPMPGGIDSNSLLPAIVGNETRERPVYLCCMAHNFQRQGLRSGGYKYIRSEDPTAAAGASEELFDLQQDPGESTDLTTRSMPSLLERMRGETTTRTARNRRLARGAKPLEMDAEYRAQLRALGYVE